MGLMRNVKKLWIMRQMVISIVIGMLGMIPNTFERRMKELETTGRIEISQNTHKSIAVTQTHVKKNSQVE